MFNVEKINSTTSKKYLLAKSNCLYYDWKSTKFTKQMPLGWVVTRKVGKVLLAFGKVGDFFFGKVANASLCIVDCKRNIQHVIDGIVLFAYLLTLFKKKIQALYNKVWRQPHSALKSKEIAICFTYKKMKWYFENLYNKVRKIIIEAKSALSQAFAFVTIFFFVKNDFTNFWHFLQLCVFGALWKDNSTGKFCS